MAQKTWMIRAGRGGEMLDTFLEKNMVGINFDCPQDLSSFQTRESLALELGRLNPTLKPGQLVMASSQLFRFAKEVKVNDSVITYDSSTRNYHFGSIAGEYRFLKEGSERLPHCRNVKWVAEVNRDLLSAGTRNSIGSIATLFLLPDTAANEIESLAKGEKPSVSETKDEEDEIGVDLLQDIQTRSREFIKDKLSGLDPYEMQDLVAGLLRAMGYKTRISPVGPDRGKDIVASPDGFGFEQPRIVVEVKHRPNESTGAPLIRSFLGGRHKDDKGLYVSTGGFSKEAHYEAERASIPITLFDLDALVDGVLEHYENIDAEVKAMVPLTKVYWPS